MNQHYPNAELLHKNVIISGWGYTENNTDYQSDLLKEGKMTVFDFGTKMFLRLFGGDRKIQAGGGDSGGK